MTMTNNVHQFTGSKAGHDSLGVERPPTLPPDFVFRLVVAVVMMGMIGLIFWSVSLEISKPSEYDLRIQSAVGRATAWERYEALSSGWSPNAWAFGGEVMFVDKSEQKWRDMAATELESALKAKDAKAIKYACVQYVDYATLANFVDAYCPNVGMNKVLSTLELANVDASNLGEAQMTNKDVATLAKSLGGSYENSNWHFASVEEKKKFLQAVRKGNKAS